MLHLSEPDNEKQRRNAPTRCVVHDASKAAVYDLTAFVAAILSEQRRIAKLLKTATAHQRALEAQLRNEITKRHQAEKLVRRASSHDSLTRLPNRVQFLSDLRVSLKRVNGAGGPNFAVCFIDLDHFKQINDTLGQLAGDRLLMEIARRLTRITRGPNIVARLGGDKFTMLLYGVSTPGAVKKLANRIASALQLPLVMGKLAAQVTASIGIVVVDDTYSSVEHVIRDADIAMCESKDRGRNRYTVLTTGLREQFALAKETQLTLRRALDHDEFRLGYQPIVSLVDAHPRPIAFEALLRWEQRDGSHITAAQFIDVAEQTGMIVELGYWVLREASVQASRWQNVGADPVVTTVNVSARQLGERGFVAAVKRIVREANVDPRLLGIEVTESILIGDAESSLAIMNELRAFGIKIYLDDFGTGYSSLSYLKKFPVDRIKIDRSFVSGVDDGLADPLIVSSIISLAHKLNILVIAEGVETRRQQIALKELRCDYAQGYLFSPAVLGAEKSLLLADDEKIADGNRLSRVWSVALRSELDIV